MINENEFASTEIARVKGEAEATATEKKEVGGEKTLTITNHLFQTDAEAQEMADKLLVRLKGRKKYCRGSTEFCPVPLELNDTIQMQERITKLENLSYPYFGDSAYKFGDASRKFRSNGIIIPYLGIVRNIKLSATPRNQTLIVTMEVKND